jgi:LysM repeat protein
VYEQKQMQDLSLERRRSVLLSFLEERSTKAAELLLKIEFVYVTKKLDDNRILIMLELIKEKDPLAEQFCKDLLLSQRSNEVWQASAKKLYEFNNQTIPEILDRESVLVYFGLQEIKKEVKKELKKENKEVVQRSEKKGQKLQKVVVKSDKSHEKAHKVKSHKVQDGENLWKIARKYKVPIEDLRAFNHLTSDKLKPGMELKIPS